MYLKKLGQIPDMFFRTIGMSASLHQKSVIDKNVGKERVSRLCY